MQKYDKIPPPGGGENLEAPKISKISEIVLQKIRKRKNKPQFLSTGWLRMIRIIKF